MCRALKAETAPRIDTYLYSVVSTAFFKTKPYAAQSKLMVLLLAVTMVVTGCRKQPQHTSAEPREELTLAYAAIPHASLVHVALVKGFFKEEGLQVNPQPHAFGKLALGAVLQGQADLASVAETPVMFAILGGKKIRVAAVIEASDRNNAILARKDLGIRNPRDLRGKTIGVAKGTNGEFFLHAFLTAQGIHLQEVTITNMTPDEMLEGLLTEKIVAAAIWNPTLILGKQALGEKGTLFYGEDIYTESFCMAAHQHFTEQRPEALRKVLRALLRAEDYVKQHPDEARQLVAKFIQIDPAVLRAVWADFRFKVTLDQSLLVTLEDVSRWAIKNHLVESREMPNYLECLSADSLLSVSPGRVRVIR